MDYVLYIVILSLFIEIIKERKKIFTWTPDWGVLFMLLLLGVTAFCVYNDNKENDRKIDDLEDGKKQLLDDISTLKYGNDFLSEQIKVTQKSYEDSLKSVAENMSFNFGVGVAKGDYNTTKILTDALTNKRELERQIAHLKEVLDSCKSDQPIITYNFSQPAITQKQSNDTFIIYPSFSNEGKVEAKHVYMDVYFLCVMDGLIAEYSHPWQFRNFQIPPKFTYTASNDACFVPKFMFDSTAHNYLLILGKYDGDKEIELCYQWGPVQSWRICGDVDLVLKMHKNPFKKHF